MKTKSLAILAASLIATSLATSVAASAQNTINFRASGAKPGSQPSTVCMSQAKAMIDVIKLYPHPANWSWTVVCDDLAWQDLGQKVGFNGNMSLVMGMTFLADKVTYIRGTAMLDAQRLADTTAEHIVAHELGHIVLNTGNEDKADHQATVWMQARERSLVAAK